MTAHFLKSLSGEPECNCGGSWPCSCRHENLYVGATAVGHTAMIGSNFGALQPAYKFMIGQRAIYRNVIVTVCAAPEDFSNYDGYIWVDNPEKMFKHYVSIDNLKPLPGGQL